MVDKVIGVDFGSAGIKLAEVLSSKGTTTVGKQAFLPLEPETIVNGAIAEDKVAAVASLLKTFLAEEKITAKRAIMGLNSVAHVFVNRATTPWHDKKDFQAAVAFDAIKEKGLIPGAPSGCMIDAVVYKDFMDPRTGDRKYDALLCAVVPDIVDRQAEVLKKAGLTVVGSDLAAFGILRALKLTPRETGQLDLIVDVGHHVLSVVIHENGVPLSVFLQPGLGGAGASGIISEQLHDDDMQYIDRLKTEEQLADDVRLAISTYNSRAAKAVGAALRSYKDLYPGGRPASVSLIGGGSHLPGLSEAITESMDVPCIPGVITPTIEGNPLAAHIDGQFHHDYTAAVGLAMGATV